MPKSIAYLKSQDIIIVTNLACDGVTLFKREFDNTLTKIQDISLNSFIFNFQVDITNNQHASLYLSSHPILHQTLKLADTNDSFTSSQLIELKLKFRYSQYVEYDYKQLFSTNGTLLNGLSSSIFYKDNIVLFSLLNDPRVCEQINYLNKLF